MNKYHIKISGKNPEYFLRLIISNNITFSNTKKNHKELTIIVSEDSLNKIRKLKTSYKISIIKRYGITKYKYLMKQYSIFLMGILLFIILINLTTKFIFNINIIHDNEEIIKLIENELEYNDIKIFSLKKTNKELDEIIQSILDENKEKIEWLEIKENGISYYVEVQERKLKEEQKECPQQHIIAKKDSRIISISAESGEIVKKINDYVKIGDTIISGLIYNNEQIMEKKCATGTVHGEVWYNVIVEIPKKYETVTETGKTNYGINLEILNKQNSLIGGFQDYESTNIDIIKNYLFPFNLSFSKFFEIKKEIYQFNYNNIDDKALEVAEEKLYQSLPINSETISKNILKKEEKDSKIIVEVFFKIKEDITDTLSIENINIEEENKIVEE